MFSHRRIGNVARTRYPRRVNSKSMADNKKQILGDATPETRHIAETLSDWLMRPIAAESVVDAKSVHAVLGTSIGLARSDNQDRAIVARFRSSASVEAFCVYAVADGLGGMVDGARCASISLGFILTHLISTRRQKNLSARLQESVQFANAQTNRIYRESGGTTISAVIATNQNIAATNVGDTRIYAHLFDGKFEQLSIDDTIAGRLAEIQNRSISSFEEQPYGGHLAQFLGQQSPVEPQSIDVSRLWRNRRKSESGEDYRGLLICTDGVHKQADTKQLMRIAGTADRPFDAIHRILKVVDWTGGADNSTALYISAFDDSIPMKNRYVKNSILEVWDSFGELVLGHLDVDAVVIPQEPKHVGPRQKPRNPRKRKRKTSKKAKREKKPVKNNDDSSQKQLEIQIIESDD